VIFKGGGLLFVNKSMELRLHLLVVVTMTSVAIASGSTLNEHLSDCRRMARFGSLPRGGLDDSNSNADAIDAQQRLLERYRLVQVTQHDPAYLHCRIPHHTEHLVAWTRARDEALLTAGEQSFTSDSRFQVSLKASESDWVLIIRRTEKSDSGCYLCEVNTEPSSSIYPVYLNVIDNKAVLAVNMDGDAVLLNCTVTMIGDDMAMDFVKWTRDGRELDVLNSNKYVAKVKRSSRTVIHTLTIREATSADGGLYACQAENTPISQHLVQIAGAASIVDCSMWRTTMLLIIMLMVFREE